MRTEAEVRARLKYWKRRVEQAQKHGTGVFWWVLKYTVEKEWAEWFLRGRKRKRRT